MSTRKNKLGVFSKIQCENDFKFKYPKIEGVYWDIETFNSISDDVPKPNDINSHISTICAVYKN